MSIGSGSSSDIPAPSARLTLLITNEELPPPPHPARKIEPATRPHTARWISFMTESPSSRAFYPRPEIGAVIVLDRHGTRTAGR